MLRNQKRSRGQVTPVRPHARRTHLGQTRRARRATVQTAESADRCIQRAVEAVPVVVSVIVEPSSFERHHRWDIPRAGTATQPDPCPLLSFPLLVASFPPSSRVPVGRLGVRTARARMVVKTMRQTTSCVGVAVGQVYRDDVDGRGHDTDTDTDTTWVEQAIVASIRRDSISSTFGPIPG